jgi:hypothetical protein
MYEMKLALFCDFEICTFDLRVFEISVSSELSFRERKKQLKVRILIVGLKDLTGRNERETIAYSKYL